MSRLLSLGGFVPWIIVAGLGGHMYLDYRRDNAPVTDWFVVKSVMVHSTVEGRPPVMTVERVILKPFVGEWSATVRRSTPDGFVMACTANGSTAYATDAVLPIPITLDWWTFPIECKLPPGKYRLDTTWTVKADGYPDKQLVTRSNLFDVTPADRGS